VLNHPVRNNRKPDFWRQTKSVASQTDVSLEDAAMVLEGAKLMRETQTAEQIEGYRSELPLRSALDWFLERRRFS
jgi:hypothetical protein